MEIKKCFGRNANEIRQFMVEQQGVCNRVDDKTISRIANRVYNAMLDFDYANKEKSPTQYEVSFCTVLKEAANLDVYGKVYDILEEGEDCHIGLIILPKSMEFYIMYFI